MTRITAAQRAVATEWRIQEGHHRMLRCPQVWAVPGSGGVFAGCVDLPRHDGRSRRVNSVGRVVPFSGRWVRL